MGLSVFFLEGLPRVSGSLIPHVRHGRRTPGDHVLSPGDRSAGRGLAGEKQLGALPASAAQSLSDKVMDQGPRVLGVAHPPGRGCGPEQRPPVWGCVLCWALGLSSWQTRRKRRGRDFHCLVFQRKMHSWLSCTTEVRLVVSDSGFPGSHF